MKSRINAACINSGVVSEVVLGFEIDQIPTPLLREELIYICSR